MDASQQEFFDIVDKLINKHLFLRTIISQCLYCDILLLMLDKECYLVVLQVSYYWREVSVLQWSCYPDLSSVYIEQRICWDTLMSLYRSEHFTFCSCWRYWCGDWGTVFGSLCYTCFEILNCLEERATAAAAVAIFSPTLSCSIDHETTVSQWKWEWHPQIRDTIPPLSPSPPDTVVCWCNTYC